MSFISTKLISKSEIAGKTFLFELEKPKGFNYFAGQWADIAIVSPAQTDLRGPIRTLSFLSSPNTKTLQFATRVRGDSAFKQSLVAADIGSEVLIDGPHGSFTLHSDNQKTAVFIAGGIGVTPFVSMLRSIFEYHTDRKVILFYSNKSPASAPFMTELTEMSERYRDFIFVPTMTSLDNNGVWHGRHGRLTKNMLLATIGTVRDKIFYVAGNVMMVGATTDLLIEMSVPEDNIHSEEFPGY